LWATHPTCADASVRLSAIVIGSCGNDIIWKVWGTWAERKAWSAECTARTTAHHERTTHFGAAHLAWIRAGSTNVAAVAEDNHCWAAEWCTHDRPAWVAAGLTALAANWARGIFIREIEVHGTTTK